jgi:hypothetical protein
MFSRANLITACGVLGPLMLGAYFMAPLFATRLVSRSSRARRRR